MNIKKYWIIDIIWTAFYIFALYLLTFFMRYNYTQGAIYIIKQINSVNCNYIIVSYLIMCAIFIIFRSISRNSFKANLFATVVIVIITLISYYKNLILKTPFVPSDILLIGNIDQIADFGLRIPSINIILCMIAIMLLLLLQLCIEKKLQIKYKFQNWKKEIYRLPLLIVGIIIIYTLCIDGKRFGRFDIQNNLGNSYAWAGGNTVFFMHLGDFYFEKPQNYSEKNINQIKTELVEVKAQEGNKINPNIIMIMNESFTDPNKIKNIRYSINPIGDIEDLAKSDKNAKLGNIITPVFGGGTSLPEFEALTGLSSYFIEKQMFPYTSYIRSDMNSVVRAYNNKYTTIGIHPNTQTFYNRKNVYKYLGFEQTIFSENIENPEIAGGNISDNELANQIIKKFEENNNEKFIFAVSMQNHMPYYKKIYEDYEIEIETKDLNNVEKIELKNYVQGVYDSNQMYIKLVNYLKNIEEPTILIMFGDHLPALDSIYAKAGYSFIEKYCTPYIIWSNYDIDYGKINLTNYMSPSNLSINVMKLANIEIPWYLKKYEELYKLYPVINNQLVITNEGKVLNTQEIMNYNIVNDCRIIQYDLLIKKKYIDIE